MLRRKTCLTFFMKLRNRPIPKQEEMDHSLDQKALSTDSGSSSESNKTNVPALEKLAQFYSDKIPACNQYV